jgi:hypothetical protein
MPEFEVNHQKGFSLRELIDFRAWTDMQLQSMEAEYSDSVILQEQLIRRIK